MLTAEDPKDATGNKLRCFYCARFRGINLQTGEEEF
jgi:hypothetical protein